MLSSKALQGLFFSAVSVALFQLPVAAQTTLYTAAYSRSLDSGFPKVETVITIRNTNNFGCNILVDWLDSAGGIIGTSGPVGLAANQTLEFTTANPMEFAHPYILDVFRNTVLDFEGAALVRTNNCPAATTLGVNANTVNYYPNYIKDDTPPSFQHISVTKGLGGRKGD